MPSMRMALQIFCSRISLLLYWWIGVQAGACPFPSSNVNAAEMPGVDTKIIMRCKNVQLPRDMAVVGVGAFHCTMTTCCHNHPTRARAQSANHLAHSDCAITTTPHVPVHSL